MCLIKHKYLNLLLKKAVIGKIPTNYYKRKGQPTIILHM